jgi:hypothetical protein
MKTIILIALFVPFFTQAESRFCERRRYGFSLRDIKENRASTLYMLTLSNGQKAKVKLRKFTGKEGKDRSGKPFYLSGNCFAFASHQRRNIPGSNKRNQKSPVTFPYMVNKKNFMKSMQMENAVYLGQDLSRVPGTLKVDPNKTYYLVAAFLKREEYHFWGMFESGWWNKPSKVGMVYGEKDLFCPSKSTLTLLNKRSLGQPYRNVGYFLFPAKK